MVLKAELQFAPDSLELTEFERKKMLSYIKILYLYFFQKWEKNFDEMDVLLNSYTKKSQRAFRYPLWNIFV